MMAAIQHRPEVETSATAENNLYQSETLASLFSRPANEVKCEDLERVVVEDDPERFFQVGVNYLYWRESNWWNF